METNEVSCPRCGAKPDGPCVSAGGNPIRGFHHARKAYAKIGERSDESGFVRAKRRFDEARDAGRARRKERRDKVEKACVAAGSPITVLSQVASGGFHRTDQPMHNRASKRSQLGMRKTRQRLSKLTARQFAKTPKPWAADQQ